MTGLAAAWVGDAPVTMLCDAGWVSEHTPGAAWRLTRLLAVERWPWTPFEF